MNANEPPKQEPDTPPLLHCIRGVRVILDTDLARLYGVPVKRLNEQFRRNRERFPEDFAFQLTKEEWPALRSQIATLKMKEKTVPYRTRPVRRNPGPTRLKPAA